jgi:polyhydroxyalkanoate synthesis regulator protein
MEEESSGEHMLPVNFLRQLMSMYGNSMQSLIPHYLEASMENFRANQAKLHKAFEDSLGNNPLARLAEQNMAMFKAAAAAFMPGADKAEPTPPPANSDTRDELAMLRQQMAEMQKKLDSLGR